MTTFSKVLLSGSTSGEPIAVAAIATPGTLIHTAHATALDEIYLYAVNISGGNVDLTVEFGGVTAAEQVFIRVKRRAGALLVVPGQVLTGGLVIRAFASVASTINIFGWVNRIA